MTSVDNLESLDNKTLREKCLAYGLPNVPITDTSKKILIRKLRIAMTAEKTPTATTTTNNAKDNPAKSRRETINVVTKKKVTTTTTVAASAAAIPEIDSKKTVRRTIAAVAVSESPTRVVNAPEPAPINNRRRSSRVTPARQEPIITIETKRAVNDGVIFEETDFADEFILIDDSHESPVKLTDQRKSVSPTLSSPKPTKIFYKKSTPPVETIPEMDYLESESIYPVVQPKPPIKSYIPTRNPEVYQSRYSQPINLGRLSAEKESFPTGYKSIYPSINTAAEISSYSFGSGGGAGGDFGIGVNKLASSTMNTTNTQSTTSRRITTGGYQQPFTSYANQRPTQVHYNENSDSNDDDGNIPIEDQAPYLSDFARRLSRLKAEPINVGFSKESSKARDSRGFVAIGGRRKSLNQNSSVGDSMKELWFVLDQKYKLKRNFFFIVLLSAIILALYYYFI